MSTPIHYIRIRPRSQDVFDVPSLGLTLECSDPANCDGYTYDPNTCHCAENSDGEACGACTQGDHEDCENPGPIENVNGGSACECARAVGCQLVEYVADEGLDCFLAEGEWSDAVYPIPCTVEWDDGSPRLHPVPKETS